MIIALLTDFDWWQLDVFYAQRKKTPDKISMKRERLDSGTHQNVTKRVMTLKKCHQSEKIGGFLMIFYDLKSGYHYHITTIISTKINCLRS